MSGVWPTTQDVALTILRWGGGLGVGSLLGLVIALLEARIASGTPQEAGRRAGWLAALLDFFRALPIIALVPVVQMLGVDEIWKIGLIVWAVMFPVWIAVRQARARQMIDTELTLMASGLTPAAMLRTYRIPKAFGGLLRGVEISIGVAWLSVVAAEWVGTYSKGFWSGGLGYKIVKAHEANNWRAMLVCLALFGILGTITTWVWRRLLYRSGRLSSGFDPMRSYES